ncbi:hypothetical protein ABT158_41290 [Nonomuraea sp. NPDC001636]|uniref:hypothetical protein n=1 Tax=Nonomuraea sp. NPDC001636 TaxID=3154391 RepID=UPI003325CF1A
MIPPLIAALASLLGVTLGVYLPRRFDQRFAARARYDAALMAACKLQAARHGVAPNVGMQYTRAVSQEEHDRIIQEFAVDAVKSFLQAASDARAAIAELYPYSPDLKRYWDKFEITEDELEELIVLLTQRRKRPLKRYQVEEIASGRAAPTPG